MRSVRTIPVVGALGPADWVTLTRAVLVGGVAALTVGSLAGRSVPVIVLVGLTVVALVLDAVDGWVARQTETASRFGARFDMEVDAFLILVLSVYVAPSTGWWVLAIGAARYALGVAGWLQPWLRAPSPPRYWSKVVAAVQGIVLTFAAADILPLWLMDLALAAALVLLVESFGNQVWWLWRHRDLAPKASDTPQAAGHRRGVRRVAAVATTILAALFVWVALVAPDQVNRLTIGAFVRIPVEGIVAITLVLILPAKVRRVVAPLVGVLLGLLTLLKIIDMGFYAELDRPFNPVSDRGYFGPGVGVLSDSIGREGAIGSVIGAVLIVVAVPVLMALAVVRLTNLVNRHRTSSIRTVTALAVAWVLCAALGAQIVAGAPIASSSAAGLAFQEVRAVHDAIIDKRVFGKQITVDAFSRTPPDDLLTGLRGKDVIVAFVESYGRVAVQDSTFSPRVDAVLDAGTQSLQASGFSSRSAFLTSPTFGGISWLAHSTLQSGLWVDTQQRYDQLLESNRLTLSSAFKDAGWRTVSDVPSNDEDWPEGTSFYHFDQEYDIRNVGYQGPAFSYASMPDQYTLSAFQRFELARTDRQPVMAEIDLVSSHTPWTPIPRMVDWSQVGDGSIFNNVAALGDSPADVWRDADDVRAAYGRSIEYSLNTLVSFVQTYGDDNLVLILLGDHQPATIVTGENASHDVPITIIAHDSTVLNRINGWGWQDGMRPNPNAPVWPMNTFRDRFLTAYGPQQHPRP